MPTHQAAAHAAPAHAPPNFMHVAVNINNAIRWMRLRSSYTAKVEVRARCHGFLTRASVTFDDTRDQLVLGTFSHSITRGLHQLGLGDNLAMLDNDIGTEPWGGTKSPVRT
jgi:hypothetical protein